MVTIDLANTSVREANERIRKYGADGTDVELVNPDARHHLGVGLVHPINVRIRGSAGYFCAGLTDAARFEVDNNVGWGVGDNMYSGRVVVRGNAGAKDRQNNPAICVIWGSSGVVEEVWSLSGALSVRAEAFRGRGEVIRWSRQ